MRRKAVNAEESYKNEYRDAAMAAAEAASRAHIFDMPSVAELREIFARFESGYSENANMRADMQRLIAAVYHLNGMNRGRNEQNNNAFK